MGVGPHEPERSREGVAAWGWGPTPSKKCFSFAASLILAASAGAFGQGRGGPPPGPPPPAKTAAPIDLTGYWVSIISEDWRWRMVVPAKGDYASVPLTPDGKKLADAWDPAKDEATGEQCKSHGAPGLMRIPGRLHLTWQDDNTLKMEADAGTQTRLFHFGEWKAPGGEPTWQGDSVASWEMPRVGGPFGPGVEAEGPDSQKPKFGSLKVVTTHLRPGYLRKNGVPYGEKTVLTEYWDTLKQRSGAQWIVITTIVDDSANLTTPWVTSLNFKKEADGSKWDASPCSSRW
jgi:hypothetical protein